MASASNTASRTEGNVKTTASYSVDTSGFGYSIITPDIRESFDFLLTDLPNKLDSVMKEVDAANAISDAFYFSNGRTVSDLTTARNKLQNDINTLKQSLTELHGAFMKDIDNINAELEYNFGWILIGEVKGATRDQVIETEDNNN